ncbi:MAG: c-type cytochrome [Alphaproteobacteria bacterium]|nr:c-type cytochrome [Alphaproteobacteria bacterium]
MAGKIPMLLVGILMMVYVVWRGMTNPDASLSANTNDPNRGQDLFTQKCAVCHEPKEGIPLKAPALGFQGQEFRLTDRQLVETAKQGGHKLSDEAAQDLSEEERLELEKMRETMRQTTAKLSTQDLKDIVVFLKKSWTSDAQLEHWMITHQPKDP